MGPINKYEQISTNMNNYQQIWTSINNYEQIWRNVNKHKQIWTNINKYKQPSTNTNKYKQILTIWIISTKKHINKYKQRSTNLNKCEQTLRQHIWTNINNYEHIGPLPSCWIRTMWKLCEKHHMAAQTSQPSKAKNRKNQP